MILFIILIMESTALILDVIKSRTLASKDRNDLQLTLFKFCDVLNRHSKDQLVGKISVSAGDSIEGVFNSPLFALDIFLLLNELIYPQKIRGGLSLGDINIGNDKGIVNSNYLDGPALHAARFNIESAKKDKKRISLSIDKETDMNIIVEDLLNSSLSLYYRSTIKQELMSQLALILFPISDSLNYKDMINDNGFLELLINSIEKLDYKKSAENLKNDLKTKWSWEKYNRDISLSYYANNLSLLLGTSRQNINKLLMKSAYQSKANLLLDAYTLIKLRR